MTASIALRPVALLGLLSFGISCIVACSDEEPAGAASSKRAGASSEAAYLVALPEITPAKGFPAKIKNYDDRTTVLRVPPTRIIAGNASLLDGLVVLVDPERMAALPSTAMTYSVLTERPEAWSEVPVLKRFEAEEIIEPQPDLVVAHAYQAGSTLDRVIEHDVPVVVFPIAGTWKQTLAELECLARIVGEEERGSAFLAQLEERRRVLQIKAPRTGLRVLPYGNYGSGGTTAGKDTTWQVMIELAGMRNAAAEAGLEGHPEIDFEQLLSIAPDFILFAKSEGQSGSGARAILEGEPLLQELEAIRHRRFLVLPEFLYSCASHQLMTAAERIAQQADEQLVAK